MQLFVDCDQVLADFDTVARSIFGDNPREVKKLIGREAFYARIKEYGTFFHDLPVLPEGKKLMDAIWRTDPIILTGCPEGGWAEPQKRAWARIHFPGIRMITCRSEDKCLHMHQPGDVLIDDYPKRNNHPPFTIKVWERTNIESMTRGKRDLLQMHGVLKSYVRPESEIGKAGQEFFDRVWYYRKLVMFDNIRAGTETIHPEVLTRCKAAMKEMRKKYGSSIGKHMTDWEWGYLNGKFAAVRSEERRVGKEC